MNNLRLLAGLLIAATLSGGVCADAQSSRMVSLKDLFISAEANSLQLRPSFAAELEAEREIAVARADLLPAINASLSLSYIGDGFITNRNYSGFSRADIPHLGTGLGINVSQPVYTGGALSAAIDLAQLKSSSSRFATELRRDNIRFSIAGFYLDLYKYHNLKRVVESNVTSARKVLSEMNARFEQGTALHNDITRYELLLSELELRLVKLENTITILNDNIVTISGLPEASIVIPDSTLLSRALPESSESMWQERALTNSPSLSLARSGIDISRKAEDLARSDYKPKVALQAAWTMDGPILVEVPPINKNLSYWYVGVGVSYNLSSLFKTDKSVAKRRAATILAQQEYEAAAENVRLAIRADYIRYLEAYEELKTQQKSVELALRNYNTTATRYAADMALITDMLDAADSRLDAEQRLVNARINIIYYYYKLLFTSGQI